MLLPLQISCQFQGKYLEGANAWEEAYRHLSGVEPTVPVKLVLIPILMYWGWLLIRLGQLNKAESVLEQSRELYRQLGIPPVPGYGTDPALPLSLIATIRGDYDTAALYGERARRESETRQHKQNYYEAYYVLASAAYGRGDYQTAQHRAQKAYNLALEVDDHWFAAYCLNELGSSTMALGDMATAQQHFETSYALRQEFNDPEGMAVALNHLGEIALRQQDYERARHRYQESLAIYQNISDKGGLAKAHTGLGTIASQRGDIQLAHHHLQQALQLAAEMDYVPLMVSILNRIGELWFKTGRPEDGSKVLGFVRQYAANDRAAKQEAQQLLNNYGPEFQERAAAPTQLENRTVADLVDEVLRAMKMGENLAW